jgi:hypothetical protein
MFKRLSGSFSGRSSPRSATPRADLVLDTTSADVDMEEVLSEEDKGEETSYMYATPAFQDLKFQVTSILNREEYIDAEILEFKVLDLGSGPRTLNVNLRDYGDSFDATGYDQLHGHGTAAEAIRLLRARKKAATPSADARVAPPVGMSSQPNSRSPSRRASRADGATSPLAFLARRPSMSIFSTSSGGSPAAKSEPSTPMPSTTHKASLG